MPPRLQHRTATIALPEGGRGRIAVVADTHSEPHPHVVELLRELGPVAILHAGDVGDLTVIDGLSRVAPVFAVRGNIDTRAREVPDTLTVNVTSGGATVLRLLLLHIAVAGPRLRADAARLARAEGASLVVCGHSHVPFATSERGLTVFNPGSIGPRRFRLPIVFGVIDLAPDRISVSHVDCETGQPWLPPPLPNSQVPHV